MFYSHFSKTVLLCPSGEERPTRETLTSPTRVPRDMAALKPEQPKYKQRKDLNMCIEVRSALGSKATKVIDSQQ
jgi:hypothetical protein